MKLGKSKFRCFANSFFCRDESTKARRGRFLLAWWPSAVSRRGHTSPFCEAIGTFDDGWTADIHFFDPCLQFSHKKVTDEREFPFEAIPGNESLSFQFLNIGNGIFHVLRFWEWIFSFPSHFHSLVLFIPLRFPNFGNISASFPSHSSWICLFTSQNKKEIEISSDILAFEYFQSRTDKSYSRSPLKKGSIFRYVWCCRVRKCIKSPVSPSRNRGKSFQCWLTMIQAVCLWYIKAFKAVISRWSCHVSLSPYTSVGSKKWSKLSTSDKKCKSYQHHRNPMSIFCGWIFLTFLHIFIHLGQFPQEGENGQNVAFFIFGSSAVTKRFDFFVAF